MRRAAASSVFANPSRHCIARGKIFSKNFRRACHILPAPLPLTAHVFSNRAERAERGSAGCVAKCASWNEDGALAQLAVVGGIEHGVDLGQRMRLDERFDLDFPIGNPL